MAGNSYNYFEQFIKLVEYSCKEADLLCKILENFNAKTLDEKLKEMHAIEHEADLEKHELTNRLIREFITPIEREDILTITEQIDDLTDTIEDVLMTMYMFNISSLRKEAFPFAEVIKKCCVALKNIFIEFSNFKKSTSINNLIIEVNRLEEEADNVYVNSVKALFAYIKDPIELMKWREVFDRMEKCCDSCEVISTTIEMISMKNS